MKLEDMNEKSTLEDFVLWKKYGISKVYFIVVVSCKKYTETFSFHKAIISHVKVKFWKSFWSQLLWSFDIFFLSTIEGKYIVYSVKMFKYFLETYFSNPHNLNIDLICLQKYYECIFFLTQLFQFCA